MKPSEALAKADKAEIHRIVREHTARHPRVFGSVLRGEDTELSDLDILVSRTAKTGHVEIGQIRKALSALLGVKVDVRTSGGLGRRFKRRVLAEARPI